MERNGMNSKLIFVLLALFGLMASSCSGDKDDVVVARYDDIGFKYSPTELQGAVEYALMIPEFVRVERLDEKFNSIDSVEVPVDSTIKNAFVFKVGERDYESPFVKIVAVFMDGKKKVEFPQYVRLWESNNNLKLNINESLIAGRIDYLMQKEDLDYAAAEEKARSEMTQLFGLDFNALYANRYNGVHYANTWGLYEPYLYCRHEISDSLFYSDYRELSEHFAKTGKIDSLMIVRAADAWLSTFAPGKDKNNRPTFKSFSRDTLFVSYANYGRVFERLYGITMPPCNSYNNQVTIENKKSEFYGRKFVCPCENEGWSSTCYYRLVDPVEDSLGLCLMQTSTVAEYNNAYYVCKEKDNVWKVESEIDTLLKYRFGECGSSATKNQFFYMKDSLFFCECKGDKCSWSDKYVNKDIGEGDSLYVTVLNARGVQKFGTCQSNNSSSGEKYPLDSVFVECQLGKWVRIDSLTYYLGGCSRDKAEHLGAYYSCEGSRYDDHYLAWLNIWKEISAPEYYGQNCSISNYGKVVNYDSTYFICESTGPCKDEDYFVVSERQRALGCNFYWKEMGNAEMIPPVINMDVCDRNSINKKVTYDGIFYECQNGKWNVVPQDSLSPPEKAGFICSDSLYDHVKHYGDTYYMCDGYFQWRTVPALKGAPYVYRDSLGSCGSITNKTIYWNETASTFFGCAKVGNAWDWSEILLGVKPYTMPESFKRENFKGGKFVGDSVYTVEVNDVTYRFVFLKNTLYLSHVDLPSGGYDAYFYNGNLFLHVERPQERLRVDSLKSTTETFEEFYKTWVSDITSYSLCGNNQTANVDTVYLTRFNVDSYKDYMDWNRASKFCPAGYHIPSSEEFMQEDYIAYLTTDMTLRNDSPLMWDYYISGCSVYGNLIYLDLFWTSNEKDESTQECFEYAWHHRDGEKGRRIVDCPKDLYPMVQALCVQDK